MGLFGICRFACGPELVVIEPGPIYIQYNPTQPNPTQPNPSHPDPT